MPASGRAVTVNVRMCPVLVEFEQIHDLDRLGPDPRVKREHVLAVVLELVRNVDVLERLDQDREESTHTLAPDERLGEHRGVELDVVGEGGGQRIEIIRSHRIGEGARGGSVVEAEGVFVIGRARRVGVRYRTSW